MGRTPVTSHCLRFALLTCAIQGCVRFGYDVMDEGQVAGRASTGGGDARSSGGTGAVASTVGGGPSTTSVSGASFGVGGGAAGGNLPGTLGGTAGNVASSSGGAFEYGGSATDGGASPWSGAAGTSGDAFAGGTAGSSGAAFTGGTPGSSGAAQSGGTISAGGTVAIGGTTSNGGLTSIAGGTTSDGGLTSIAGGASFTGGATSIAGGAPATGGLASTAGASGMGGTAPTGGAAGSGAAAGASGAPGGKCDWSSAPPQFGAATSLGKPNSGTPEIDPVLSHDALTIYFVHYTDSVTGNDIYYATRSSVTGKFGNPALYSPASSTGNDTHLFISADGLEAFVASNRSDPLAVGGVDIFRATRATTTSAWGSFAPVANVNSTGGDFDPHLESDGLTLWFDPIGRVDGAGAQDIFFARRTSQTTGFGAPTPATALNTIDNEWNVSLTDDGRVVVFQSDRGGTAHVYYATRASRTANFGAPAVIGALDPYMATLGDPFVAPDGCSIYFAADLGSGSADLYVVEAL